MSKKVIEQKYYKSFEIDSTEKDIIQIWQQDGSESNLVMIEKELCTTVAKAIDPEYQKVIDQNDKLVEALEELVELKRMKHLDGEHPSEEYLRRKPIAWNNAYQALQNTKNIEG